MFAGAAVTEPPSPPPAAPPAPAPDFHAYPTDSAQRHDARAAHNGTYSSSSSTQRARKQLSAARKAQTEFTKQLQAF